MGETAVFFNQNLSKRGLMRILEARGESDLRLMDQIRDTAVNHPEIAEDFLRSVPGMPFISVDVRCFASLALAALQAKRQHQRNLRSLGVLRQRQEISRHFARENGWLLWPQEDSGTSSPTIDAGSALRRPTGESK